MLAASTFYPPIEQYTIAVMDLHSDAITPQIRALLARINELASLGDALHAIQALDGHFYNEQTARALLQQSADLLVLIAASLSGSASEVLRLRAASLLGEGHAEAAIAQVDVVLRADVERATVLLAEHDFHSGHVLSRLLTKLTRDFHHLPTDFAFNTLHESLE